jgi:uncharacterized protein (DUF3084 family)
MSNIDQPSLLYDNPNMGSKEELENAKQLFRQSISRLSTKVNELIEKISRAESDNETLRDTIKEFNGKVQDLKIEINRLNSESLQKDKEISNFKNMVLSLQTRKTSLQDKENVRSRIKELISRIDTHLEQSETDSGTGDIEDF